MSEWDFEFSDEEAEVMNIIYAGQPFPKFTRKSIFLAGPTPRSSAVKSWRPDALALLAAYGYDGDVYIPEPEDMINRNRERAGEWKVEDYTNQIEWENEGLERADCILFWIPRDMVTMPALTTNDEFGYWKGSGKCVLGTPDPDKTPHVRYQRLFAERLHIPVADTLDRCVQLAMDKVGEGAMRHLGETKVPLHIWRTQAFQEWHSQHRCNGNRLDDARVLWSFRVGPKKDIVFSWALHVDVFIAAENRHKVNEYVLSRTDISTVLLWYEPEGAKGIDDLEIVLVREFRSPVRNSEGFVYELPGGSSKNTEEEAIRVAADEVHEETGFQIDSSRLNFVSHRQVAATLSSHHAHLFTAKLTADEITWFKTNGNRAHGVETDSERTYVHVMSVREILNSDFVDWSTIGMILSVLRWND